MRTRYSRMTTMALGVIAFGFVTLAVACERPPTEPLAPVDREPASASDALANVDLSAIADIRDRAVLGVDDDERGPLLAAVAAVEDAVAAGRPQDVERALRVLRQAADVLPDAESSALDLALGDLARQAKISSPLPQTP